MTNLASAFCGVILMLFIHTCPFVATGEKWLQCSESRNTKAPPPPPSLFCELNQITKIRQVQ